MVRRVVPDYRGEAAALAARCREAGSLRLASVCEAVSAGVGALLEADAAAAVAGLGDLIEWELAPSCGAWVLEQARVADELGELLAAAGLGVVVRDCAGEARAGVTLGGMVRALDSFRLEVSSADGERAGWVFCIPQQHSGSPVELFSDYGVRSSAAGAVLERIMLELEARGDA